MNTISLKKNRISLLVLLTYISGAQLASATLLDPSQSPLILTESVAPNLILTLDDSGSMRWAYVPDSIDGLSATRRVKSATFNPMYYNPAVTYTTPIKYDTNGARSSTQYSTSFTSAYFNGFDTSKGSVNLSTDYRATWTYNPATTPNTLNLGNSDFGDQFTSNSYGENPASDFSGTSTTTTTPPITTSGTFTDSRNSTMGKNSSRNYETSGVKFTIRRFDTTCEVTFTSPITSTNSTTTLIDTPTTGQTTTETTDTITNYATPGTCSKSGSTYNISTATNTTSTTTTIISTSSKTRAVVPAYYYVYDTTQTSCTNNIIDDNCYRLVNVTSTSGIIRSDDSASGTDERLNFARWYSFYRNRALTTLASANLAFTGLPRSIRLTWQTLGGCTSFNSDSCGKNYLRKFTSNHVGNFFNWLPSIAFNYSTPLRSAMIKAGDFIAGNSSDAWASDPNPLTSTGGAGTTVQNPQYACRASYQIMMTDGIWNQAATMPSNFRHDGANISQLPDGIGVYSQQTPFVDTASETLADLAFHYWATDANTSLSNDIKPIIVAPNASSASAQYWDPRNDPATWQHLNTFTIGIGLNAALNADGLPWGGDTFAGSGYNALVNDTADWPAAGLISTSTGKNENVYDLWHTAINSRGEFFNADSPDTIVQAFRDIISRISNRTTSAGAPGVTASIVEDTLTREVYETKFNSEDWSGDLTKFRITEQGVRSAIWNAQAKIPSSRNIKIYSSSSSSKLQDLNWDALSDAQKALLNRDDDLTNTPTDSKGSQRLDYILGDQSREGSTAGTFRIRSSVLGDIVNSSPVIVGTPKYVSYLADQIDGGVNTDGSSKYAEFKAENRAHKLPNETTATPRRPMVYVGANDGMLHGFDADTGIETFAYVPSAVFQNLYKLPAQRYKGTNHQFFVDGTPSVADVYFDDEWHTVLVGTLRSGGRSLFALDITDPDNIELLWERSFNDADYGNLGYTFPQPAIARLHTGNWAVVIGNGYGNQADATADRASLMVINIKTGALQRELVVPSDTTKANGLSSVRLADNNSDGIADYAYAGDLQGNMWRFDLVSTSATPSSPDPFRKDLIGTLQPSIFSISYNSSPLYTATDSRTSGATKQAITAPPSLVRHPTSLGYLVIFGTGKYFETNDGTVDTTRAMTLYGIWDQKTKGQTTSTATPATRTNLQQQTITEQATSNPFSANETVQGLRILSQNPVAWYDANNNVNKKGWYLDFKVDGATTNTGEMLINSMAARGKVLLLNTLTPNANPCKEGVDSWLYGLDPATGGRTNFNVFDLNNDKVVDANDSVPRNGSNTVVSSYKKPGSGGFTTNNGDIYTAPSQGSGMKYSAGPTSKGRQSWRIIPEEAQ